LPRPFGAGVPGGPPGDPWGAKVWDTPGHLNKSSKPGGGAPG